MKIGSRSVAAELRKRILNENLDFGFFLAELAKLPVPPGLLPARLEAAGGGIPGDHGSQARTQVPNNFGGCSENDIPVVENGLLQAASRMK